MDECRAEDFQAALTGQKGGFEVMAHMRCRFLFFYSFHRSGLVGSVVFLQLAVRDPCL